MRRPIELLLYTIRRVNRLCGELKKFLQQDPGDLVFRSQFGNPLLETTILNRGLYPVSETVGFTERRFPRVPTWMQPKMGAAGLNPAVIRQQMGHTSHRMTTLYSGEIPLAQVAEAFSR